MSTWGWSLEVRKLLEQRICHRSSSQMPCPSDSYTASLSDLAITKRSPPNLPPKDYIIYLSHVADHHLNANYYFFNRQVFQDRLTKQSFNDFSGGSEVWQTEILMIIALGKLFLERGATSLGPPGIREFLLSAITLPSNFTLIENPITAIEALCLLVIYAQAADMHRLAYLYVSNRT